MGVGSQAESYHQQSKWGGDMDPMHLFHLWYLCQIIRDGDRVVDLACGTGDLLIKLAKAFPRAEFLGVDLSDQMLAEARKSVTAQSLKNISFQKGDITQLSEVDSASADLVTSTMALHHLPDKNDLMATADAVHRILVPGGRVYISDFLLMSRPAAEYLVFQNPHQQDKTFQTDFLNSLLAAFSPPDLTEFAQKLTSTKTQVKVCSLVHLMVQIRPRYRFSLGKFFHFLRIVPWKEISGRAVMDFLRLKLLQG